MAWYQFLPTLNAFLNGTSAMFLALGYFFIRIKAIAFHRLCMMTAFITSSLFLISYLTYHALAGVIHFKGQGLLRTTYFTILISHTALAGLVVPLAIITFRRALAGNFERHRSIARWTL